MALSTVTGAVLAELVGKIFVQFYYDHLQNRPQLLHCMYEESSKLSLPDTNGVMVSVTTTQAINDMLLSCDYYKGCKVNYETVDSQLSQNDGISILVTGYLTRLEKTRRKFCQTFFLASKGDGVTYNILNDIFRFVDSSQPKQLNEDLKEAVVVVQKHKGGGTATHPSEGMPENGGEVNCTSGTENIVGEQKLSVVPASKTYESVVKGSALPLPVYVTEPEKPLGVSTNHVSDGADHSVFVNNLPLDATVNLLEMEFTKFGRIVPGGVQVKWNQTGSYCYGFVEFEEKKSMQDALMASQVTVAGRCVFIEKKRTPVRVRNGIVISGRPSQYPSRSDGMSNGGFFSDFCSERGNFSAPGRFQDFPPQGFPNRMQPHFFPNGRTGQQGSFPNGSRRMGQVRNIQNGMGW